MNVEFVVANSVRVVGDDLYGAFGTIADWGKGVYSVMEESSHQ